MSEFKFYPIADDLLGGVDMQKERLKSIRQYGGQCGEATDGILENVVEARGWAYEKSRSFRAPLVTTFHEILGRLVIEGLKDWEHAGIFTNNTRFKNAVARSAEAFTAGFKQQAPLIHERLLQAASVGLSGLFHSLWVPGTPRSAQASSHLRAAADTYAEKILKPSNKILDRR